MTFTKLENMPALDEHAVNVIVETPKGHASKYKYDAEHGISDWKNLCRLVSCFHSTLGLCHQPLAGMAIRWMC
jgi:hypothetical protein